MPRAPAVSRAQYLDQASERLASSGIEGARREAMILAGAALGRPPAEVVLHADEPMPAAVVEALDHAVERRRRGEPLAYVTGAAGFRFLELACDRRGLIPRPETELLVELMLDRVTTGLAADIGTGSGCLALSLVREGSFDRVVALDTSAEALALTSVNATRNGLPLLLIRGDLATSLAPESMDALVANPPYLTTGEYRVLDPAVRRWEPRLALESGADGLAATRRLVPDAVRVLRPGGWLGLETDASRADAVSRLMDRAGLEQVTIERDLFERKRFVLARRRG